MTKFAFVTGANKGIGYELVRQLAEKEYHVFLGARNEKLGQQAVQSLGFSKVSFVLVDISDIQSVHNAKNKILEVTDHLDLLINNAGIAPDFNILPSELQVETLRSAFDINFFGTFQMIQAFLPLVKKSQRGKIVNVTTDMASQTMFDNGEVGQLNLLGYNSSKTAVNSLTLAFGKELGESGPEIFGVTPGFTTTDLNGNAPGGKTTAEGAQIILNHTLSEINYNGKILDKNGVIPW
ncbi:SDR family NAD(P)-dependent oxidoreductase [Fictibacillus enclensis]|uniref:SDR family NAD(P)-dependent oxidoreductase n=1 Tax=Fictibacillus enclensis TaxID=1017270 RepID=UPI0025A014E0|nr:SDR family NAD(P)-dependent oxidoreductase [Fictibacillus enclensis]MDM5197253.1 SDR family NAD(P)-dependent oxidoreductase [Fictibacillus enclensis]